MKAKETPYSGQKIKCKDNRVLKVLSVVDGYAMCRYSGCYPFVRTITELKELIKTIKA